MNYELADKAIRDMNRRNLMAFDRLKTLKFDELNVMRMVSKVYDDSVRLAKRRYLEIAEDAFIEAMLLAGMAEEEAEGKLEDSITEDWVLDMLEDYNELTLYRFDTEVERKKQRTAEAILASLDKSAEVDKSMRLWTRQVAQYADNAVVYASIDGYKGAGVKKVKWISEHDAKVCNTCHERDGKIYQIDKLPLYPAHYFCRCIIAPAK